MKRSRQLSLMLMGASALTLTACDEPLNEVAVFETLEQCVAEGFEQRFCRENMAIAQQEHLKSAPRYASEQDCAADFGDDGCREYRTGSGGSLFLPLMLGYMMGNMLGGGKRAYSQPLYRSRDDRNGFRTADNAKVGNRIGRTTVARSVASPPAARTSISRRGGFGAAAGRYSSGRSSFFRGAGG